MAKQINVALVGNPNTGKTSVFNQLTGLNQKVGNYPGITVEKKEGISKISRVLKAHILDLPGTYSLNASSLDESVVIELLLNKNDKDFPDVIVVISDAENLKRNLLLFTQIKDLGIPTILAINMADRMDRKGISIDVAGLEKRLGTKIALLSARKKTGFDKLKSLIESYKNLSTEPCLSASEIDPAYFKNSKRYIQMKTYTSFGLSFLRMQISATSIGTESKPILTSKRNQNLKSNGFNTKKPLNAISSSTKHSMRFWLKTLMMPQVYVQNSTAY